MLANHRNRLTAPGSLPEPSADAPFETVMIALGPNASDEVLAAAIDADARTRLSRGQGVDFGAYLRAIPDLPSMPISLDAAIEFSIRAFTLKGMTASNAADALARLYPQHSAAIRTAATLGQVIGASSDIRTQESEPAAISLPAEIGDPLPSGQARYELREKLGSGTHGSVYLANDRLLSDDGRPAWVAIKVLGSDAGPGPHALPHADEARRARRINHPAVVRVLDRGSSTKYGTYIVSEFVDGPSLQAWLKSRSLPLAPRDAARLIAIVARGLQAAHAAGLVHCDLKPDNILLTRKDEPKVTDFGLAVDIEQARRKTTALRSSSPIGSLAFMAPEQYQLTEEAFSVHSDIYSLGGILYYLITGLLPNGQTVQEVRERLARPVSDTAELPVPPSPRLDRDLFAICRRALAPRPSDRYQSADALANDLRSWLNHEPIPWLKRSAPRRLTLFAMREPLAAALVLGIILACTGFGGLVVYLKDRADRHLYQARFEAAKKFEVEAKLFYRNMYDTMLSLDVLADGPDNIKQTWLPAVTILESVMGPKLFTKADPDGLIWTKRSQMVGAMIDEAKTTGASPDMELLLWQTAMGFWEAQRAHAADAQRILEPALQAWRKMLGPADAWVSYVAEIKACADTRATLQQSPVVKDDLRRAVASLESGIPVFVGRRSADPVHRLVLETLCDAYSTDGLNVPEKYQRTRVLLDNVRDGIKPPTPGPTGNTPN
jgi:hypothetical protein